MNLQEIKKAVDSGIKVYWAHEGYKVIKDKLNQYYVHCIDNNHYSCLEGHFCDGAMSESEAEKFYIAITYHRNPTKGEIRFGEGAIHYRDFKRSEVAKPDGSLKQWFVADDSLRYYY